MAVEEAQRIAGDSLAVGNLGVGNLAVGTPVVAGMHPSDTLPVDNLIKYNSNFNSSISNQTRKIVIKGVYRRALRGRNPNWWLILTVITHNFFFS